MSNFNVLATRLLSAIGVMRKSCLVVLLVALFADLVRGNAAEPSFSAHQWVPIQLSSIPSERVTETNAEAYFGPPYNNLARGTLDMYLPAFVSLQEPSLYVQRTNAALREYRFTYVPSWHSPFVLRLMQTTNGPVMFMKAWGYSDCPFSTQPPFVARFHLTTNQWDYFASQIRTNTFWEMQPYPDMPEVTDGAGWLLEALDHGRYHLVDRNTIEEGEFHRLCRILLNWAPVEPGDLGFLRLNNEISKHLRQAFPRKLEWENGMPKNRTCPNCHEKLRFCFGSSGFIAATPKAYRQVFACANDHLWLLDPSDGFVEPPTREDCARVEQFYQEWSYSRSYK